jgi:DNA polymerase-3 subunit gamma/tau
MVVLRLAAAAALPPPEGARMASPTREIAPANGPSVQREPAEARREERPHSSGAGSHAPVVGLSSGANALAALEHHGPRISTMRDILAEVEKRREIGLQWEIEQFVRPIEIEFGHFHYVADKAAPGDMAAKIKAFLERATEHEWDVVQSKAAAAVATPVETAAETRNRKTRETLDAARAHPRIAEALKAFPGAKVLRVDTPQAEEIEEAADNVVHVDFGKQAGRAEPGVDEGPPPSAPLEAYIDAPEEPEED